MPLVPRSLRRGHKSSASPRTVMFEAVQDCNQDCVFCYNVWKCTDYPRGQLGMRETRRLLDRIISDYRPEQIAFTGGEPLLRLDLPDLIRHIAGRVRCSVITNGILLTSELALDLVRSGVKTLQFTLLSADREVHDALVRRKSFDRLIEAITFTRAAGAGVATTFVATRANIHTFRETIELNVALGVRWVLFNRFNVGGEGLRNADGLMPGVEQIEDALAVADEAVGRYGITITCGVPIPPCVIDMSRYRNLYSPNCPIGTRGSYPTVDPLGNVRWCNHSPAILGNVLDTPLGRIVSSRSARARIGALPVMCSQCKHSCTCRGGCRAAAQVCGGSDLDPIVALRGQGDAVLGRHL